jgi:hypothetical protein
MDRKISTEGNEDTNIRQKTKKENFEQKSLNKSVSVFKPNLNKSTNKVNNNDDGLLILNELDFDLLQERDYTEESFSEEEEKIETLEKEKNDRDNFMKIVDMEANSLYKLEITEEKKVNNQILKFSQFSAEIKKLPELETIQENKEFPRKTLNTKKSSLPLDTVKSEVQKTDKENKDLNDLNRQTIKNGSNRIKEIFKDYGNKLGAEGKAESKHLKSTSNAVNNQQKSAEDENKLNSLNLIKNSLFKQLKLKNKENDIRVCERNYQVFMKKKKEAQPVQNDFRSSQKDFQKISSDNYIDFRSRTSIMPFTSMKNKKKENEKKLNKNQLMKKRKRLLRYLKIKKYKKQVKKKQKEMGNFLKIKSYIDNKNFIYSNSQFSEWKQFLEEQIKYIFSQKILNTNYMTKTLINNFEITPFLESAKIETINSNNNMLILFDDQTYKDVEKFKDNTNSNRPTINLNFKPENTHTDTDVNTNIETLNKMKENQIICNEEEDSTIMNQKKKDADKEKLLVQLKKKLEDLKSRNVFIDEAKKIIDGDQSKNKNMSSTQTQTLKPKPTIEGAATNTKITMFSQFGANGIFVADDKLAKLTPKLDSNDKMKVKQRILNHSMKIYDKFDLKKIIIFWRNNMKKEDFVNRKKSSMGGKSKKDEAEAKKLKESNSQQKNKVDDKKTGNNIVNIKQNFAQPNDNVKKIIPFFNNVYTIQKNES